MKLREAILYPFRRIYSVLNVQTIERLPFWECGVCVWILLPFVLNVGGGVVPGLFGYQAWGVWTLSGIVWAGYWGWVASKLDGW